MGNQNSLAADSVLSGTIALVSGQQRNFPSPNELIIHLGKKQRYAEKKLVSDLKSEGIGSFVVSEDYENLGIIKAKIGVLSRNSDDFVEAGNCFRAAWRNELENTSSANPDIPVIVATQYSQLAADAYLSGDDFIDAQPMCEFGIIILSQLKARAVAINCLPLEKHLLNRLIKIRTTYIRCLVALSDSAGAKVQSQDIQAERAELINLLANHATRA